MEQHVWKWETAEYEFQARVRDWRDDRRGAKTRLYVELGAADPRGPWWKDGGQAVTESEFDAQVTEYRRLSKEGAQSVLTELLAAKINPNLALAGTSIFVRRGVTARFSWKAGCSCGCSCGCVANQRILFNGAVVDIWVTLKAGKPAAWIQPELAEAMSE